MKPRCGLAALLAVCLAAPALAQAPGWTYSPLRGEGDRAAIGCDRAATTESFTCLVVRCEDDFSTGIHVHSSRPEGDVGRWVMTVDRENATLSASLSDAPYGARFFGEVDWLLDRLRHGAFVILKHADDPQSAPDAFVDLGGSLYAITTALAFCAPRVPAAAG